MNQQALQSHLSALISRWENDALTPDGVGKVGAGVGQIP